MISDLGHKLTYSGMSAINVFPKSFLAGIFLLYSVFSLVRLSRVGFLGTSRWYLKLFGFVGVNSVLEGSITFRVSV